MVDRNIVVDRSPQAARAYPRFKLDSENPTISQSPETQKCNIQDINEDNCRCQIHKIYHFQNCGPVYIDSFNAHGVKMENCGNSVPQVTCSLSFSL